MINLKDTEEELKTLFAFKRILQKQHVELRKAGLPDDHPTVLAVQHILLDLLAYEQIITVTVVCTKVYKLLDQLPDKEMAFESEADFWKAMEAWRYIADGLLTPVVHT